MSKKVMISDKQAQELLAVKPKAKGKKRRTEIQNDAELEGKLEKKVAEHRVARREPEYDSKVSSGAVRAVVGETIARVYEEIWPGMSVRARDEEPNDEIKEEAYILTLTMVLGNNEDTPRMGLRIREAEFIIPLCREHEDG